MSDDQAEPPTEPKGQHWDKFDRWFVFVSCMAVATCVAMIVIEREYYPEFLPRPLLYAMTGLSFLLLTASRILITVR